MNQPDYTEKIVTFSELKNKIKPWTATVIPGSFDLFHIGHLRAIARSSECKGPLIVVIASDKRVKNQKNERLPIIKETHRLEIIAGLACVDYVVLWKSLSHQVYLNEIRPRRVTFEKDGSKTLSQMKRVDMIQNEYPKTELLFLPRTENISTTKEIKDIFAKRFLKDLNHYTT